MKLQCYIILTLLLTLSFPITLMANNGEYNVRTGETSFECTQFECNGAQLVPKQTWILNSKDSMKFRAEYKAIWKFKKIPISFITGDSINLVINCRVWSADPNSGGHPGFAYVKVIIPVNSQDRTIEKQIELSNNAKGAILPTILTLPKNIIQKDGVIEVSLIGKGWIEVQPLSIKICATLSNKPLKL